MSKINIRPHLKRRLIIVTMIIVYSYIYSYMIALLLAETPETIYFHFSSGLVISIFGCLAIFIVHNIDQQIDKIMAKSSKFVFLINFLISFFTSVVIFAVITWLLNVILRDLWVLDFQYFKEQLIVINYLFILLLSYYTISYFSKSSELRNKKLKAENLEMSIALNKYVTRIPSLSNKKTVLIPVNSVLFFNIEDGVVFANTSENKMHPLTTTTLNDLESTLNPAVFFRINRSEIVHIDKISSYEPYFKDRLAIKLSNSQTTLYTSNKRSSSFREWLTSASK